MIRGKRHEPCPGSVQFESGIVVSAPTLLCDLDGTLVDSVYQHVLAWREALEESGLEL